MPAFPRDYRFLAVGVVMLVACRSESPAPTVNLVGFGPIRFGMKIEDAQQALGVRLEKTNAYDDEGCLYYVPQGTLPGLWFMTSNGVVVRLDVEDTQEIRTDKGAKIGDREARVLNLYAGRIEVRPQRYNGPDGHSLVVKSADSKAQLVFETDGMKVLNYRAGVEPQVHYVEGCS